MRTWLVAGFALVAAVVAWVVLRAPALDERASPATQSMRATNDGRVELEPVTDPARSVEAEPADEADRPSSAPESTLTGGVSPAGGIVLEVVDAKGAPRAGVKLGVELELWRLLGPQHPDRDQHQEVVTDARGRAPIAASHPSEIGFVALHRAEGNDLIAAQPFDLAPGTSGVVRLVFPERIVLRGVVRDFAGQVPTIATRVELEPHQVAPGADGMQRFLGERASMRPDAAGNYALEITPGWYTLGAALAGETTVETLTLHVLDEPAELAVDLRVPRTDRRVHVALVADEPIDPLLAFVGASAVVGLPQGEAPPCVVARHLEEVRHHAPHVGGGRWRLDLVSGVDYELVAGAPGFDTAKLRLPIDVTELGVRLVRESAREVRVLRGRFRGPHGPPTNGLVLLRRPSDLGEIGRAEPREDGAFEIVLPDVSGVRTTALLHGFSVEGFAVLGPIAIDRSRDDLELVIGPPLTIAGRVEGLKDPAGARFVLRAAAADLARPEHDPLGAGLTTRALYSYVEDLAPDGLFAVDGLAAGEYELFVEPASGAQPPARLRVRAGTKDVRVVLGYGLERDVVFDCTVVDALTHRPLAGAEIEARGPGAEVQGWTDAAGRCELRGAIAGRWCLAAKALDHASAIELYVDYAPGRHTIELALSPSCAVDLELVDARGAPLSGIEVAVTTTYGVLLDTLDHFGQWDGSVQETNVAGRCRLSGLPLGVRRVIVGWSKGGARRIELANGGYWVEGALAGRPGEGAGIENVGVLATFDVELAPGPPVRVRRTLP